MAQTKHVTLPSGALEELRLIVVDTISDLRGLATAYQVVRVKGHTTSGDGGGGEFVLIGTGATPGDIDSSGDDDNGFHIVNTAGYLWQRQSDVVTPQMFGAFPLATVALARASSTDLADTVQRALDFFAYPNPAVFGGISFSSQPMMSRDFLLPHGHYPCESTIEIEFGTEAGQPDASYDWTNRYVPGKLIMLGHIFTPYDTDIVAITLHSHLQGSRDKIQLSAYKDVHSSTSKKRFCATTFPGIYTDDTVLRTWANSTKYYRDEEIKYVSSGITYVLKCTKTGESATATPTLTGASFGSGGLFYCRGVSRLADATGMPGRNMDQMLMDSRDVGIQIRQLHSASNVELSAYNYCIGVQMLNREAVSDVIWSDIEMTRLNGCKVGVFQCGFTSDRIVELGQRTSYTGMPEGSVIWETGFPATHSSFLGGKLWESGKTGIVANDIIYYTLNYPIGTSQRWAWRVTDVGDGILGSNAPTSSQCNTTPWQDGTGKPTLVCIGSAYGTRYTMTSGSWVESPAAIQNKYLLHYANTCRFRVRYIVPLWQGSGTVDGNQSLYGIVVTGHYSQNDNTYDNVDMSALPSYWGGPITSSPSDPTLLSEACEVLLYSGSQNRFITRQEDYTSAPCVKVPWRNPEGMATGNTIIPSRIGNTHSGGRANVVADTCNILRDDVCLDVNFSDSLTFSGFVNIVSRDMSFVAYDTAATLTLSQLVAAGTAAVAAGPRYHPLDDSWSFPHHIGTGSITPCVMIDLAADVTNSSILSFAPIFGDPAYSTSDRWMRYAIYAVEEDGVTKIDPALIPITTRGAGNYACAVLANTIINRGVPTPASLQQTLTRKVMYDHATTTSELETVLAIHPLVKRVCLVISGGHLRGFRVRVTGSRGNRIYHPPLVNGTAQSRDMRVINTTVPMKGIFRAPVTVRFRDGTGAYEHAFLVAAPDITYYATSGPIAGLGGLGASDHRQWASDGTTGSATIKEWNGSDWDVVATDAYFIDDSDWSGV